METIRFKCELLSDVIINQKAATEGPNATLDFIPGNCFLGIVASKVYREKGECRETLDLFHSKKVRFGDAHPVRSGGTTRGLKIPALMYYPKLKKASEKCYINSLIPNPDDEELKKEQLKQCRNGFFDFSDVNAIKITTNTSFAIKSAYDKDKRRSKDEKMYGYESLQKGLVFFFEVETDNEAYAKTIKDALIGDRHVGRSRTAQYGLVRISEYEKDFNIKSNKKNGNQYVTVYADGRLIFFDENGNTTFQPTATQLGIENGEICWEKSQIRTFQYSPWNYARQCFDTDRCGIEKGSVFVVKTSEDPCESKYVGSYNNEGFGKVIYNPCFLEADSKGIAKYKPTDKEEIEDCDGAPLGGTILLDFIGAKKTEEELVYDVYEKVNKWVKDNKQKFKSDSFASQWGTIRSIAMKTSTKEGLLYELFDKTVIKKDLERNRDIEEKAGYLTHGVATEKWSQGGRANLLRTFIEEQDDRSVQLAVINLAAEMAKEMKR